MDAKAAPLPPPISAATRSPSRITLSRSLKLIALLLLGSFWVIANTANTTTRSAPCASNWPWSPAPKKTNVILMISDGYGPASQTFTRSFYQVLTNNTTPDAHFRLPLDPLLVGSHRSRSSNSLITDSAAGATAFSCAKKSYNGAIGVDSDGKPCGTVFEAAKRNGYLTGVVVTTRLTDATPAAFVSHAASRAEEPLIASQLIGGDKNPLGERTLDLAIGGGGCAFLPLPDSASCRQDDENTVEKARKLGWDVRVGFPNNSTKSLRPEQAAPAPTLPYMELQAPGNLPFEIDRQNMPKGIRPPPLVKGATKALELLTSAPENKKGFILMIEGSQIDLCAHNNDAACHAREALAYQDTVAAVRAFIDAHPDEHTLLISTSDHETGGVTLGRQLSPAYPNYAYYPERLLDVRHSAPLLAAVLLDFARTHRPAASDLRHFIQREILGTPGLGLPHPSKEETTRVLDAVKAELANPPASQVSDFHALSPVPPTGINHVRKAIADVAARRAEIGFSTEGHTGVDINVYAYGNGADALRGNNENTYVS